MADDFLSVFKGLGLKLKPGVDSDFADRLNWSFTTSLYALFAVIIGAKQYLVGNVIHCWANAEWTDYMVQYVEEFCFINSTYWVADNASIPDDYEKREQTKIGYYQWAPWVLGLLALGFYLPHILWRLCNLKSGINVQHAVKEAADLQGMNPDGDEREKKLEKLADHIHKTLMLQNGYKQGDTGRASRVVRNVNLMGGHFLSLLYLTVKVLHLLMSIAQLFVLQAFLDKPTHFIGWTMIVNLFRGQDWSTIGLFPRVTYCDYSIRTLGNNLQRNTNQCVLSINMLNEKLFTFLWWWVAFLVVINVLTLFNWMDRIFFKFSRKNFIKSYLKSGERNVEYSNARKLMKQPQAKLEDVKPSQNEKDFEQFVLHYLRTDGVFVLRLISWNAGIAITGRLLYVLMQKMRVMRAVKLQIPDENKEGVTSEKVIPVEADV